MPTEIQKRAAQAIVNIFETGRATGDYAALACLPGDTGGLSYGRAQATLGSGALALLLNAYETAPGAAYSDALKAYLGRVISGDETLAADLSFRQHLVDAGADPVMQDTQDAFFDRLYWQPARRHADHLGITSALGHAVIYDSMIHGSFALIRKRVMARHGMPDAIGEQTWVSAYVLARRTWLAGHSRLVLRRTAYRMRAFQRLIDERRWDLALPFTIRNVLIDRAALRPWRPVPAYPRRPRLLYVRTPPMAGEDVCALACALRKAGLEPPPGDQYTPDLARVVRLFQTRTGLVVDGITGPATRDALDLEP